MIDFKDEGVGNFMLM